MLFVSFHTGEALSGCILAAGLLFCFYRFEQTSFLQDTHDMMGHLEYITFIANHGGYLPKPYSRWESCWECYQPPLYYFLEALFLMLANWLGSFDTISVLRLFSLGCHLTFLVFATWTLRMLIHNRLAYYTALLLLIFYPSGMIAPTQINNIELFYMLYSGCLYFTLRWLETTRTRHLGIALTLLGLGFATRTNALMLIPLMALTGVYQWRRRGWPGIHLRSKAVLVGMIALVGGLSADFGRTAYYNYTENQHTPFIVGNYSEPTDHRVTNSLEKFLVLDIKSYFREPFWHCWDQQSIGRQYFWNTLFKSSFLVNSTGNKLR